jgi:hypothetical protein
LRAALAAPDRRQTPRAASELDLDLGLDERLCPFLSSHSFSRARHGVEKIQVSRAGPIAEAS